LQYEDRKIKSNNYISQKEGCTEKKKKNKTYWGKLKKVLGEKKKTRS